MLNDYPGSFSDSNYVYIPILFCDILCYLLLWCIFITLERPDV